MARTVLGVGKCRECGAILRYPGKGRPRRLCTDCRPPGAAPPSRVSSDFREDVEARRLARAQAAARSAAARAVARDHPTEYQTALEVELLERGVYRCPHCGAAVSASAGACFRCGQLIGVPE